MHCRSPGSRSADRRRRVIAAEEVRQPALYRLYRATASRHSILCPSPKPCPVRGPPTTIASP
jgi:hypothetical protein